MAVEGVRLEEGKYGIRAVITSAWSAEILKCLLSNDVVELELNDGKGWRGDNISFLVELPNLQAFKILDLKISSIVPVHTLRQLRSLEVVTYCKTKINFLAFSRIEECALEWRAGADSVFDCTMLKKLFVNRYKGNSIDPFGRLVNLESLAILNAPIKDLHKIDTLQKLRCLRLANLNQLRSLAGIEALVNVEEVDINTCRSIENIVELRALFKLRELHIDNGGVIASLKPLENLIGLDSVSFYGSTNILDGDLLPLFKKNNLCRISFKNRRHYSHAREEFGVAYEG